jgi:hypothetical protein
MWLTLLYNRTGFLHNGSGFLHNRTVFLHNGWAGAACGQRETEPQKRLSAEGRSKRRKLEPGVTAARPNKLT